MKLSRKALTLIEGKNFGYLATLMKNGSPQVSPVWIDHVGSTILVNTTMGRVKQKNAKRNPKIALSIADASDQYEKVIVRGEVVEQTTRGADEHIDKLAQKYLGGKTYPWRKPGMKRVLLKIRADHISED